MKSLTLFLVLVCISYNTASVKINVKDLQCLVCQNSIQELNTVISKLDPTKTVDVGGHRLDASGNYKHKTVSQTKSELKLSELIETICDKMDDYVRATDKITKELTLIKLIGADGKMNPQMSEYDIIQDDDLNKSLKYYCESLMEEHEEDIIKLYQDDSEDVKSAICTEETKYCLKNKDEL